MSIKKKRLLTAGGITAFAVLIIALFLFAVKQRNAYTSGGLGTVQYTTLGTIQEMFSHLIISWQMKKSGLFLCGVQRCWGKRIQTQISAG